MSFCTIETSVKPKYFGIWSIGNVLASHCLQSIAGLKSRKNQRIYIIVAISHILKHVLSKIPIKYKKLTVKVRSTMISSAKTSSIKITIA